VGARRWASTLVLDFQQVRDTVEVEGGGAHSEQRLRRVGAALELSWRDAPSVATSMPVRELPGSLFLKVVDAKTGAPLPDARVTLTVGGQVRAPVAVDAEGKVEAAELPAGEVSALVSASGHEASEGRATVEPGGRATLEVRANPLAPTTGSLRVTVVNAQNGVPLPGVRMMVGTAQVRTDLAGRARVDGLAPGPVAVAVTVAGFRPAEEAALIVAGQDAELSVPLAPERKKGELSTLTGQVRSTRGGRPLVATLLIAQARVRTRTGAAGTFSVRVRGGTYRIVISARGHVSQTKTVTLRDGEQAIFNVDLFPRRR
jgi:hypothetical protein